MSSPAFDDRDGSIWFDGELIDFRSAKIHVLSHGLHYASAVFEGERVYNGRIFKSVEHTERLHKSAETVGYAIPYSTEVIEKAKADVVKSMGFQDGYVRPIAWRGTEMMGVSAQNNTIHLAITAWEWPSYFDPEAKTKGIKMELSRWRRPAPDTAPTQSKASGLYQICTMAKHEAEAAGMHDALMLDYRGLVAEATGANIFFVMDDGKLHTPTPDCFLDGITRRTVIDLARRRGFEIVERQIKPEEMANASECFLTGTAVEVTPVGQIGNYSFIPGEVCNVLGEDYTRLVRDGDSAVAAE
ncbi:MAG: branched-chain amino acid aminotransferase [Pseudomonadota bacterium]|nr:branched-chain amino acid aminotransferase [Rhodospirillaceae bacterium]MBO91303.1 branched-chain amino acid aminotransferase [Rhodospirillaceae bacterium]MEC7972817.1 branched-chain amino acid aminotransferase [Pseudomonadota bacterium]MEC9101750.1 branched-chain amino acid aminotransferase [Pseudomonadota bacterium]|tara:strand:+ start:1291 stop:2190 length:900 start_codon:yes stop_codon:yes gene_type:complete